MSIRQRVIGGPLTNDLDIQQSIRPARNIDTVLGSILVCNLSSDSVNKYRAKKVVIDGIKFDSIKESKRYLELKLLEKAGEIQYLELQPRYNFRLNGVNLGFYKADFRYLEYKETGELIIEDVKGFKTPVYRLKKKMMKAFYGIDILET